MGIMPEVVAQARDRHNTEAQGAIIREVLADRIQQLLKEDGGRFRSIKPADLERLQGHADALELALGIVSQPLILNP